MSLQKNRRALALFLALAVFGCGDDDSSATDAGTDSGTERDTGPQDSGQPMPLAGCEGGECFFVAEVVDLPVAMDGVSVGRNIDGVDSVVDGPDGCGREDFTHPRTGESGIDNQLQTLVPAVNAFLVDETVSDFLAGVIADGRLALLMKLEGADSTEDDDVTITVYRGSVPAGRVIALDADGTIEADQTFDIVLDLLEPTTVQGQIRGGRVTAMLPEVSLPLHIGGVRLTLTVRDAMMSAAITENGLEDGEMSGHLNVEEFAATAEGIAMGLDVAMLLEPRSDLNPNGEGVCQDVSAAIVFSGITAVEGVTY